VDACAAIQRAAAAWAAAAARMAGGVGAGPPGTGVGLLRISAMLIAPAPSSTAATTARVSTRHRA
jgi:hypothetical protein